MNRDRGYYRSARAKAIQRRKCISQHCLGLNWYRYDGQYAKGKVHCSCWCCRPARQEAKFRDKREELRAVYEELT